MKTPPAAIQAALVASLLGSLGVAARESFNIVPADDGFAHGRVIGFDPTECKDLAPHGLLSAHALRGPAPGAAGPDALRRFLAPDVPANCGRFVEYPLYDYVGDRPTFGSVDEEADRFGADFPTLRHPPHRLVTQRVASRGLAVEVDATREETGAGWAQAQVDFLRGVLDRERLRRTLTLFVAAAVRAERVWDGDADPDADVHAELDAQTLRASRVVYGPGAWARRDRTLRAGGPRSPEDLAGALEVDGVQVVRAAGLAGGGDVGSQVLLFCAGEGLSRNDFSNLKTFTAPARGGGRYAAYLQPVGGDGDRWRVGVECHETVAITSPVGLGIITVG